MDGFPRLKIDLGEQFPPLKEAPIIEAIIHWQAQASRPLPVETLSTELRSRLPEYPMCEPQAQVSLEIDSSTMLDTPLQVEPRISWNGLRLQDEQHHVVQFTPTGVVFSRLAPYANWRNFQTEAMKHWDVFHEIASPLTIQRLGVRYINQILLGSNEQPSTYLQMEIPQASLIGLLSESFFYQDTYEVPGLPYGINWIRTIQAQPQNRRVLIFDIQVFTTIEIVELDRATLTQHLDEMRWLKNKIFFGCITQTALERFGA